MEAGSAPVLEDPTAEPADDDLLELDAAEEDEADDEKPVADDSEELEMWMRQTRRAQLLTP